MSPPDWTDPNARIHIRAVHFEDKAADEGEPSTIEELRFHRLGRVVELDRCLGVLIQITPAQLDEPDLGGLAKSPADLPKTVEEALSSMGDRKLLSAAMRQLLLALGANVGQAFLSPVRVERHWCDEQVQGLQASQGFDGRQPIERLEEMRKGHQKDLNTLRRSCPSVTWGLSDEALVGAGRQVGGRVLPPRGQECLSFGRRCKRLQRGVWSGGNAV